jgi:hypothetical protein
MVNNSFPDGIRKIFLANCVSELPEDSIGIHWYGGNPTSNYCNINGIQEQSTISQLIRRIYA